MLSVDDEGDAFSATVDASHDRAEGRLFRDEKFLCALHQLTDTAIRCVQSSFRFARERDKFQLILSLEFAHTATIRIGCLWE